MSSSALENGTGVCGAVTISIGARSEPNAFRATSADVVHGFLIEGTNINTMLVPGYISQLSARFTTTGEHLMPCQEFCGAGHQGMWAKVKVVDRATFMDMAAKARRLSCVE